VKDSPLIVAEVEGFRSGAYVLATKYCDGDPGDHWAIGFYVGSFRDRHLVCDALGGLFRYNGFRRMQRISAKRGEWMLRHVSDIEKTSFWTDEHDRRRGRSVWSWARERMNVQEVLP
jgi:hypothetical protein